MQSLLPGQQEERPQERRYQRWFLVWTEVKIGYFVTQKARAMMCSHFLSQGARPSPQNVLRLWNHSISSGNHPCLAYRRKGWKRPEGKSFFGEKKWVIVAFPLPLIYESQWDRAFLPPVNPKERDFKGTAWRLHSGPGWILIHAQESKKWETVALGLREQRRGTGLCTFTDDKDKEMVSFPKGQVDPQEEGCLVIPSQDSKHENCF